HIAAAEIAHGRLLASIGRLHDALARKAAEFDSIVKIGRTHGQDAAPVRLGQEFGGYARQLAASIERIRAALEAIYELPLGGTAVGTGLNAPARFAAAVIAELGGPAGVALI